MSDARALIEQLQAFHAQAKIDDVGSYQRLTDPIVKLTEALREGYSASVQDQLRAVIEKMNANAPLSQADLTQIESFIVGDAEAYTRLENNFPDWIA